MTIAFESKDGRRIWSITEKAGGYDVNGIRFDGTGWAIAGHNQFSTLEAAEGFCRDICGDGAKRTVESALGAGKGAGDVKTRPGAGAGAAR